MLNGYPSFWIDGDALPTDQFNCGNSEVWSASMSFQNSQSRGICNTNLKEWFDLPDDYSYSQEVWGEFYYKSYGEIRIQTVKLKIPGKLFLKVGCRTSVTFKL